MTEITLHNGDCLEVMKGIPDKSIDLIMCDLPFGCLSSSVSTCKWDVKIDLKAFWTEVRRIRKTDNSPCIHFTTTKYGYELIQSNPDEFRYDLVWDKQRGVSFLSANVMPMRSHEMIYVFSKKKAYYNRIDLSGNYPNTVVSKVRKERATITGLMIPIIMRDNTGKRCALSVISNIPKYSNRRVIKQHPTEKPCELYKFLIERYCPLDGTVLDPTFGSGNSVFTAFEMGRNAIGIEKNEEFYKRAEKRLNE